MNNIILYIPQTASTSVPAGLPTTDTTEILNKLFQIGDNIKDVAIDEDALGKSLFEDAIIVECQLSDDDETEICISHNDDHTFDSTITCLTRIAFYEYGYTATINNPITGCVAPKSDFAYHSMKITIGRSWYMRVLHNNPRQWMRWAASINQVYLELKYTHRC